MVEIRLDSKIADLASLVYTEGGTSEDEMALYYAIENAIEARLLHIRKRAERDRKTRI